MTKPLKGQPNRVQSKIVNKRQAPWGLIVATVLIVALAVGVIGYAVSRGTKKKDAANPDKITGIQHYANLSRNHEDGVLSFPQTPPVGGDHAPIWADCTGTVYPNPIANENAVHSLEHGAVWITYKPGLPADQLDALIRLAAGQQFTFMSPYPQLTTNVSLQSWGYQPFADSASDPRVKQFVTVLRRNQKTTPEVGARCDNAQFKANPGTPGHPFIQQG
jgi:hypothetical protein